MLLPCPAFAQDEAWEGLITAGKSALNLNKFSEAERLFETALETAEKFPPGDPRLGRSLNNLAAVYYAQKDFSRAEPLMRRSLNVLKEALGPSNDDVAQTKKNLAALHYLQGDFDKAEPLLEESLATFEELHGPNHQIVAAVLNNLAGLYQAQNRYQDAEPLLSRSLKIWESQLGSDHPDVVKSRELLNKLRVANGLEPDRSEEIKTAEAVEETPAEPGPNFEEPVDAQSLIIAAEEASSKPADTTGAEPSATLTAIQDRNLGEQGNDRGGAEEAARALVELTKSETAARAKENEANAASPPPEPETAAATFSPPVELRDDGTDPVFAVYLSTLWSKDEAERYWQALKQEVPDILGDKEMELEEVALASGQGSFYRVLTTPFTSDPEAQEACDLIRSQVRTHDCNVIAR